MAGEMISMNEVQMESYRWTDTSYLRVDGKTEYRELKEYGNRHAVFNRGARWGKVHVDQYNATDIPKGAKIMQQNT